MDLDFALIADAAEAVNGKLHLINGAFDMIWTNQVPLTYPRISFVIRLLMDASEVGRKHKIEISIMSEDGKRVGPTVGGELEVQRSPHLPKGWKQGFLAVVNIASLKFPDFGDYSFELMVNDSCLKSVPLRLAQKASIQS